tara:strand:+ start:1228 stop:1689 length:462 start_codon:yes stop_codon:yes gene_type:complete
MAYFAKIVQKTDPTGITNDTHWIVENVISAGNDIETSNGPLGENDMHVDGETWCQKFFKGGTWKQTSYNNNFRKMYAGIGMVYNESKDKFLAPQPYASWTLNANDDWEAPVAYPTDKDNKGITWDEDNQRWVAVDLEDNSYNWNTSTLSWDAV